jgi:hypothetical protein
MTKPLIVGEWNPYPDKDDAFALYPSPEGCSGHRLCCLILGMRRATYLESFDRCNLVNGEKWTMKAARAKATELAEKRPRVILLGSKVCSAFGVPFKPFEVAESPLKFAIVLPHPSGLCRLWNLDNAFAKARDAVAAFVPEVGPHLGVADGE